MKKLALIMLLVLILGIYCLRYIPSSYYENVISDVYYYQDINDEKVPVPTGFIIDENNNVVDKGLVIIDNTDSITKGNQFVWIPCKDFKRNDWENDKLNFKNYNLNFIDEKEYQDILKSVNKYNGFYVARYEASKSEYYVDDVLIANSLPNQKPWNEINYATNMLDKYGISNGALKSAKYTYKDKKNVNSTILYPEHFDSIISWFLNNGINLEDINELGNYNNKFSLTGSYKILNVYDLFGNVWEWTTESYLGNYHIIRGGSYRSDVTLQRRNNDAYTIDFSIGFRLVLII